MFNKSIPIVMYHHVSPPGKELNVQPENFQDHLSILCSKGWKTLSGEEFLYFLQNNEIPKKCVLLTFDDGFADNYIYAYPLLKKYGMKAMLFAATFFIEDIEVKRNRFIPLSHKDAKNLAFTERRSEVMCTWQELKEMEDSGIFDIQSHGHSHNTPQYLKEKKYTELKEDLLVSKKILEKRLSKYILHFCWPGGKYDQTGVDIATEAG
ncbi:MAG: polysaccharide deacetylase family protein, partial [Candidatus Mariimomonas ferrooxydans]